MRKSLLIATLLSFLIISATAFAFPPVPPPPNVSDTAYDAGTWDGNADAATKNAIRDKIETLAGGHDAATLTGDDANATDGTQAMTIAGGGIVATTVAGSTVTVTGTEVDGDTTNEINTITADDANTTAGLAITVAGGGIAATTVAGDTVTVTATEVDSVVGAITGIVMSDGGGNISAAASGTDYAAADHDATHAVSGADTVFPADPGADRYLMWDDDPGQLTWAEVSAGGLFDAVTGVSTGNASIEKSDPTFTFENTDAEDTDEGRQSTIIWKGHQSGNEETTLATLYCGHNGNADDEKGHCVISANDGNDGNSPSIKFSFDENGYFYTHTGYSIGPDSTYRLDISGDNLRLFSNSQTVITTDSSDKFIYWGSTTTGWYQRWNAGDSPSDPAMKLNSVGRLLINTTDDDNTPAVGRLTVKGTTNDGTTYPLVLRDSDEANVFQINSDGDITTPLVAASRIVNEPMTFSFTDDANITDPITSSIVLLDGDNDGDNDTIDLQDGETAGQHLYLIAHADIDADDTCAINYGDTTCTGCPAVTFDAVGEAAQYIWTGATWVYISGNN